ncbi:tumor necrosis factor receptor superfamily member 1A-like [Mobula hypostoma]|uniref:tumor necrosis factor receptor superfamily member 1A-like n=1 Tax=Mobula hypostoma TaxID=723540 RepID=UPI002FC277EE
MQGTGLACLRRLFLVLACLAVGLSVGLAAHGDPVKGEVIQGSYRNRIVRHPDCVTEEYYAVRSHLCCKKCPAGTRVAAHCQKDLDSAKCQPCAAGEEYTEWENGLEKCLPCQTCREDQRQVSPCTPQKNTVCECRAGTFCAPDQACEVCQKCKAHCPGGEITKNCTPTSDTECRKAKPEADSTATGGSYVAIVITLVVILVLSFAISAMCYKRELCEIMRKINGRLYKRDSADSEYQTVHVAPSEAVSENHHRENRTSVDTCIYVIDTDVELSQAESTTLLQNSPEGPAGSGPVAKGSVSLPVGHGDDSLGQSELTGPKDLACTFDTGQLCHCGAAAITTRGSSSTESSSQNTHEASPSAPYRGTEARSHQHHCTDDESVDLEDLRQSFILLVNEVPIKMWKQYMRKLSLTENEIETAEQNNSKNVTEANYQMLNTWLQKTGKGASLHTLLSTLKEMDLNDAVHNVQRKIRHELKQRK